MRRGKLEACLLSRCAFLMYEASSPLGGALEVSSQPQQ